MHFERTGAQLHSVYILNIYKYIMVTYIFRKKHTVRFVCVF